MVYIYSTNNANKISNYATKNNQTTKSISLLEDKVNIIKTSIKEKSNQQLINNYKTIEKELAMISDKINNFQETIVPNKELHKLNKLILDNKNKINILFFSPIKNEKKENENNNKQLKNVYYKISLKGDYPNIFNYIRFMESLQWKIFWHKFSYNTEKYPEANVDIIFNIKTRNENI